MDGANVWSAATCHRFQSADMSAHSKISWFVGAFARLSIEFSFDTRIRLVNLTSL
jgi:hypothetical protein